MLTGWWANILTGVITVNQILTAGIAITAFSLFLYALSFNLQDRVSRAFAIILVCIVIIFTAEALESSSDTVETISIFLQLEWIGIVFLPSAYYHLSQGLLSAVGVRTEFKSKTLGYLAYAVSCIFLLLLAFGHLLGPLVPLGQPAPHLVRTIWTEIFTIYYIMLMLFAWFNFRKAYKRTLTRFGRRRMLYLLAGAIAPTFGSFPYLLYGSSLAEKHPLLFWSAATSVNLAMGGLIIIMAYAVAFYGVSWPDRVIKTRLVKWIMRGPVTASAALGAMTIVRRIGDYFGIVYSGAVPTTMVTVVLLMEHAITLFAPFWERFVFIGGDRTDLALLQSLEDRMITQGDLRQFLESQLAAIRDNFQSTSVFIAVLDEKNPSLVVGTGNPPLPKDTNLDEIIKNSAVGFEDLYEWGKYWIFPLRKIIDSDIEDPLLLGLLGIMRTESTVLSEELNQVLILMNRRIIQALEDRLLQKKVFLSLEELKPETELIQRWRAEGQYDIDAKLLTDATLTESSLANLVRDALAHYWGGPKLTQSPLLRLNIVQQLFIESGDNPVNALRSVLHQAIDSIRPLGERKFTAEWILYNILEMKFIEGHKVKDVAVRLAVSEADLYRKQRLAIEEVARAILALENQVIKPSEQE